MVTIKDISKKTGYSIATVSKVINGIGRIPEETRKIVLEAAGELGYVPNYSARFLKTTESSTIGVIYEGNANFGLYHPFFSRVLEYFRREIESQGYDILLLSKNFGDAKLSYLEHAKMKGVDGILVLCGPMEEDNFTEVFKSNLPSVILDHIYETTTTVTSKTTDSIYDLISKLKNYGHEEIAYIHGSQYTFIGKNRMDDFISAMVKNDIKVRDDLLVQSGYYNREDGKQIAKQLMSLDKPPTAIFCASDDVALGVIDELKQSGIRVPEDVSVIGFDGIRDEKYGDLRLGYIKQSIKDIGKTAAQSILNQIDQKKKDINKVIYIDTEFIENDTVGKKN